ncbi:D-lactate dehydrogenase [Rhodovastum atsumiense]|uniref:2-hydroxyacid dehydrogenase n=1 Tax=Rhodovastum atsumiense TaxID=504468 RepID=A0A5M6IXP4_9PROT|nr:2-hydroxyacid dehydrogenase [Rhodovastum atsumiense]KAA5613041.1 2-hydroxyacid dehydrogenase [Rhodovastum atsumiense]CAH2600104.1 D-lactate dehydrogenase [Rhodovastum atsumiense]
MRVVVFSTKGYDRRTLEDRNGAFGHELVFQEPRLTLATVPLATGFPVVCGFVNDVFDEAVMEHLAAGGTRLIALRAAGFNNVDLRAAARFGIAVVRVPAYSPHAVAEFTVGLILSLVRGIHRAHARTRANNFTLDGLLGFDLHGRTVGVVGTGRIGALVARALALGFGCHVLAHDVRPDPDLLAAGIRYADLPNLIAASDVITLHCPLTPATRHLVRRETIATMRPGALLVNTSRGALIDAEDVVEALKDGRLGGLAIDVYEQEADLFFEDLSNEIVRDDTLQRLLMFPNVLVTSHQAFFTQEALVAIADTTLGSIASFARGEPLAHAVTEAVIAKAPAA